MGVIPIEVRSESLFELMRRATEAMRELAGGRELVVGVDDGQLLDQISAALVLHLVSSAAAFVVATVRSDEKCPDAIVTLWKDRLVPRIELGQLDQANTDRLVETMLGGPAEEAVRQWAWDTSRGNPLYVRELLLGALSDGALTQVHGLWRMPTRPPVSSSLVDVISARLAGFAELEQHLLELLALGEPLLVSELVALAGRDPLAAIEARGLITVDGPRGGDLEVRLAHPMYGEGIRARLGAFRAHEARVELAKVLQSRPQQTPDTLLRIARWLLDAREPVPTETLVQAARAANLAGDPELGTALADAAVAAGAGIDASLVLARAWTIRRQFDRAEEVLSAVEGQFESHDVALEYVEQRSQVLSFGLQRHDATKELLNRAQTWWPDEDWQLRLAPFRLIAGIRSKGSANDPNTIWAESTELIAKPGIDPDTRRRLEAVQLASLYRSGRGREAQELARRIRPSPPLRDTQDEAVLALSVNITVETGEGLDEVDDWAAPMFRQAVHLGDRESAGLAALAVAHHRLLQARHTEAARWLAEGQIQLEQHDAHGLLPLILALQTAVAADTRDPAGADTALAALRAALGDREALPLQARFLTCAGAWTASANGDRQRAQQILLEGTLKFSGFPLYMARFLYAAMRCGAPAATVAPGLAAISRQCDARLVTAKASHATHLAAADPSALLGTVAEFETIGAMLFAREAAADAAKLFAAAGRDDSARRAAARRLDLFVEGQGTTPAPIPGFDGVEELTPRESEILDLAALGLSHRQIAERLVLLIRTVESHIYHARQKLGGRPDPSSMVRR